MKIDMAVKMEACRWAGRALLVASTVFGTTFSRRAALNAAAWAVGRLMLRPMAQKARQAALDAAWRTHAADVEFALNGSAGVPAAAHDPLSRVD